MKAKGNNLYEIIDPNTGEWITFNRTTTGYDGTTITSTNEAAYIDNVIYVKLSAANGGGYAKRVIPTGIIDIKSLGAKADGVTDDILAFERAIDLASKIGFQILIGNRTHLVSRTIKLKTGVQIVGLGRKSIIKGSSVVGPIIQTHDLSGATTSTDILLDNFAVNGSGDCAVAWTHTTGSKMDRISLEGFSGTNGFVFESSWGNTFGSLRTNGSGISNACFLLGKVFLDATFDLLYTSNISNYSVLIDSESSLYSNNSWAGWGVIDFKNITLQGATKNGMWIKSGHRINFNTVYSENAHNTIRIGDSSAGTSGFGCGEINFNQVSVIGGTSTTEYGFLFDRCWNITINNLHTIYDLVYNKAYKIQINNIRCGFAAGDFPKDYLKRGQNYATDGGVNMKYGGLYGRSEEISKFSGYGDKYIISYYDALGGLTTEYFNAVSKTITL